MLLKCCRRAIKDPKNAAQNRQSNKCTLQADLLVNFGQYWRNCDQVANPAEARQQLLAKIIDRVFVYDDQVIAIALHGNFGVVLDNQHLAPQELVAQLKSQFDPEKAKGAEEEISCTQSGSDGTRSFAGIRSVVFLPSQLAEVYLKVLFAPAHFRGLH